MTILFSCFWSIIRILITSLVVFGVACNLMFSRSFDWKTLRLKSHDSHGFTLKNSLASLKCQNILLCGVFSVLVRIKRNPERLRLLTGQTRTVFSYSRDFSEVTSRVGNIIIKILTFHHFLSNSVCFFCFLVMLWKKNYCVRVIYTARNTRTSNFTVVFRVFYDVSRVILIHHFIFHSS